MVPLRLALWLLLVASFTICLSLASIEAKAEAGADLEAELREAEVHMSGSHATGASHANVAAPGARLVEQLRLGALSEVQLLDLQLDERPHRIFLFPWHDHADTAHIFVESSGMALGSGASSPAEVERILHSHMVALTRCTSSGYGPIPVLSQHEYEECLERAALIEDELEGQSAMQWLERERQQRQRRQQLRHDKERTVEGAGKAQKGGRWRGQRMAASDEKALRSLLASVGQEDYTPG